MAITQCLPNIVGHQRSDQPFQRIRKVCVGGRKIRGNINPARTGAKTKTALATADRVMGDFHPVAIKYFGSVQECFERRGFQGIHVKSFDPWRTPLAGITWNKYDVPISVRDPLNRESIVVRRRYAAFLPAVLKMNGIR